MLCGTFKHAASQFLNVIRYFELSKWNTSLENQSRHLQAPWIEKTKGPQAAGAEGSPERTCHRAKCGDSSWYHQGVPLPRCPMDSTGHCQLPVWEWASAQAESRAWSRQLPVTEGWVPGFLCSLSFHKCPGCRIGILLPSWTGHESFHLPGHLPIQSPPLLLF